jgi:nuclear cap-binding protein subunit 1
MSTLLIQCTTLTTCRIGDLELSNLQPKKAFIIAALDKEIRLSFAKRIRSTLPQEMNELIPARLDEDNSPEFKYDNPGMPLKYTVFVTALILVEIPYSAQAKELIQQLKKKAPAEEVQKTIDQIHELATEQGVADVLIPSTDAFVTAICRLGAKSLAHVLSCIERGKDRLIEVAQTSEAARRQIVASVFGYWKDQPGVAVRIIDILLNYTILAPMTVIQWVLGENLGAGEGLAESWVYEIVSITIAKVSSRNRQIVNSRVVKGLPQDMIDMVESTLSKDRDAARELFKYLEDVLGGIAQGSADRLIEKEMNGEISKEDGELVRAWGKRWHTVFVRKSAVEESVVGEQAVEARIKLLAAEPDPEPEAMDTEGTNGEAMEEVAANGD